MKKEDIRMFYVDVDGGFYSDYWMKTLYNYASSKASREILPVYFSNELTLVVF